MEIINYKSFLLIRIYFYEAKIDIVFFNYEFVQFLCCQLINYLAYDWNSLHDAQHFEQLSQKNNSIFSHGSDLTTTNVCPLVRPSIS